MIHEGLDLGGPSLNARMGVLKGVLKGSARGVALLDFRGGGVNFSAL